MAVKRSGIIASEADRIQAIQWAKERANAPVIKVGNQWLHDAAEEQFVKKIDELAASYGLPPLPPVDGKADHYGMLTSGEFTTLDHSAPPDGNPRRAALLSHDVDALH